MSTTNQHRRRISVPATPPETPLDAYFSQKQTELPPHSTNVTIYPDSPPITPTRLPPGQGQKDSLLSEREQEKRKEKERTVLPTHGRRTSVAYASHRRTSTATIIRLAAARQGLVLTPTKVVTLFLIVFSATYLASFLPGPLSNLLHHRSSRSNGKPAPTYYSVPTVSNVRNNRPVAHSMPIGETAQRRAWEDAFPHRIPPQQHVVPVRHDSNNVARSHDGDLYRAHPELLLANTDSLPRRRPLRFGKPAADDSKLGGTHRHSEDRRAERVGSDSSLDDAAHSPRRPTVPAERQAQINRMKKMAAVKQGEVKVGSSAPLDSSSSSNGSEERVIVDGAKGSKRKVRVAKAGSTEESPSAKEAAKREGKPRLGLKDRQVKDDEIHKVGKARTVDDWAELEDK